MNTFKNKDGFSILEKIVKAIQDNKDYLGDVDGLIGDGDHGANMAKGFTLFAHDFADQGLSFSEGLFELGNVLLTKIGGSMGPIYGTVFMDMSESSEDIEDIGLSELAQMLRAGLDGLCEIVDAKVGDKTLVDTLSPAVEALEQDVKAQVEFLTALDHMTAAAKEGMESTKDLVAKFGRSSRLGERSRGVLDAGATSCFIILSALADGIKALIA